MLPALRPVDPVGRRARVRPLQWASIGSLLLIAGKIQIASIVIFADVETDAPQAAASLSVVLLRALLLVLV